MHEPADAGVDFVESAHFTAFELDTDRTIRILIVLDRCRVDFLEPILHIRATDYGVKTSGSGNIPGPFLVCHLTKLKSRVDPIYIHYCVYETALCHIQFGRISPGPAGHRILAAVARIQISRDRAHFPSFEFFCKQGRPYTSEVPSLAVIDQLL